MSDNIVSAFINGVEHVATDIEELVGHAADALANLGIGLFNGMEWFIHFLIEMHEDPVHVISRMAAKIAEIGASVVSTLEEIVNGIRTHGLTGYLRIKVQDTLTPFHNTMTQQVSQSNQLTTLHQNTLTTMQQKLDALKNNGTNASWRGPSVDAMSAAFTLHASTLTDLTAAFNNQNIVTNKYAQDTAIDNFMTMLVIFALVDLLIIISGLVAAPFTAGASVLAEGGLLEEAIIVELAALLIYSEISNITWQHGTSGLYFVTTQTTQTQPQTGSGSDGQDTKKKPKPIPPIPPGGQGPQNNLTPEQQRLHNDVASRLAGTIYDSREIDDLIRAGYLDPDAIAAIIRGGRGTFAIFNDPNNAAMMNELTTAQQLKFITIVEQYQMTHPGLTSHQVYNYLRYVKIKAQLDLLSNDITARSGDPVSQAIGSAFSSEVSDLNTRLYQKVGNSISGTTDPFTLADDKLDGWYSNLTGIWGEWSMVKHYYQQGNLVALSTPLSPSGEVDLKINENGVEKWIEVKNTLTTNQWGKAITQAGIYAQNGAKDIILEFPQQGVNGTPDLSQQQLNNLNRLRALYPGVNFEVRTGASDPGIQIPFDPPSNNWGSSLP